MTSNSPSRSAWMLITLVVALPLFSYPLSWLPASTTTSRSLTLPIAVAVTAGLLLWAAFRTPRCPRPLLWPVLAGVISLLLSMRFSRQPHLSLATLPAWVGHIGLLFLAVNFPREHLRRLAWCWLVAAVVVAVNGLVRLAGHEQFVSTIGNWNVTGAYLAATIPVGLALRDRRATALCALLVPAIYFCHSRGAWLALVIVALAWMFFSGMRRLALIGMVACLAGGLWLGGRWQKEDVRPLIWQGTLQMIAAKPVVGHGLGTFVANFPSFRPTEYFAQPKATTVTDHAHNELLETAAETGILGVGAMLWLWWVVAVRGRRACRENPLLAGFAGAAIVLAVHGFVDVGLRHPPLMPLFWILLGLLAGNDGARELHLRGLWTVLCIAGAGWLAYAGVIQPVRADLAERQGKLREALRYQPFRLHTRFMLAQQLAATSPTEAITVLEQLESLAPDYATTSYNLGVLYLSIGRAAQALPHLRRAIEINPNDPDAKRALETARLARDGL